MTDYSLIDELIQGMACICRAQELLEAGAPRQQIAEALQQSLEALECFMQEMAIELGNSTGTASVINN